MSRKSNKSKSHGSKPKSKWTPDLLEQSSGASKDDAILARLSSKLGVTDSDIPATFVDDGLDYLLKLPKYGAGAEDDSDDAVAPVKPKKAAKTAKRPKKEPIAAVAPPAAAAKPTIKKKAKIVVEELHEDEDDEDDEDDAMDADAVLAALKKQKAAKKKKQPPADEIDDLFSKLADKKKKAKKKKTTTKTPPSFASSRPEGDGFGGRALVGSGRKLTEEGFPIYTEEELGLTGRGGDTPDCPFDCQCCV